MYIDKRTWMHARLHCPTKVGQLNTENVYAKKNRTHTWYTNNNKNNFRFVDCVGNLKSD